MKRRMMNTISTFICITALSFVSAVGADQDAYDDLGFGGFHPTRHRPPPVPAELEVPPGNRAFLLGEGIGTQNYVCLPDGWAFAGPQATLFNIRGRQNITHFLSPNPFEADTPRATWQHSRDSSIVWAQVVESSSDPVFVEPDAIPWLLLEVVGADTGPTFGRRLTRTTYIHRVFTTGGLAPITPCPDPQNGTPVGTRSFVPYTADYWFYRPIWYW